MSEETRKVAISARISPETRAKALEMAKARGTTFSKIIEDFIESSIDYAKESNGDITDRVIMKMQDSFPQLMDGGNAEELADLVIMKMQDSFPILMGDDVASESVDLDNDDEAELMEELAERGKNSVEDYPEEVEGIFIKDFNDETAVKFDEKVSAVLDMANEMKHDLSEDEARSLLFAYMLDNVDDILKNWSAFNKNNDYDIFAMKYERKSKND